MGQFGYQNHKPKFFFNKQETIQEDNKKERW